MSSSRKCAGRLFQTRGPVAAKLLSPNVLWVRGTARDLSVDEHSRRRGPSETGVCHQPGTEVPGRTKTRRQNSVCPLYCIVLLYNLFQHVVQCRNSMFYERPLAKLHYHSSPALQLTDTLKQVATRCSLVYLTHTKLNINPDNCFHICLSYVVYSQCLSGHFSVRCLCY